MRVTSFNKIFHDAAFFILQKKSLWIFGLILALGSITYTLTLDLNLSVFHDPSLSFLDLVELLFTHSPSSWEVIIIGSISLFLYYLLHIISLISIYLISKEETAQQAHLCVKSLLHTSTRYLWSIVFLRIFIGFILSLVFCILFAPSALLYSYERIELSFILFTLAIFIYIPILFVFFYIRKYAQFYIILANLTVLNSLDLAYKLLRTNTRQSLIFGVFMAFFNIIFELIFVSAVIFFFLLILMPGALAYILSLDLFLKILIVSSYLLILLWGLFTNIVNILFSEISWLTFFRIIATQDDPLENSLVAKEEEEENLLVDTQGALS